MTELNIDVAGMDCSGCEESVKRAVRQVDGVRDVQADHQSGKVMVEVAGEADRGGIRTAIEDAGYDVVGI